MLDILGDMMAMRLRTFWTSKGTSLSKGSGHIGYPQGHDGHEAEDMLHIPVELIPMGSISAENPYWHDGQDAEDMLDIRGDMMAKRLRTDWKSLGTSCS